ncbi:MAG: hypothetical protein HYV95_08525 [Opitutae bacterium]|nr:hypothetical protein [Opitutae bacterium]
MSYVPKQPQEPAVRKTNWVLLGVIFGFVLLGAAMLANIWGRSVERPAIPLVDPSFLEQTAWRRSYADLVRAKEDLSDFDCYVCHEKKNPPPLRFDDKHNLIVPEEHETIKMGHGSHDRNNLCFNCHNEANLVTFSTRDGKELKFAESSRLCGSCHGPNYRDWEAGVHGRMNGYWNHSLGEFRRLDCVNCHNPHSPRIPTRQPAPAPHPLRASAESAKSATTH